MKKTLLALSAILIATSAFATSPLEQVPRPQILQQQIDLVGGGVTGGMLAAQMNQRQMLEQQLVKQRQFDAPVMIKTVLPAGVVVQRRPWLEATTSPRIPTLWVLATHDQQKVPDPSDVVTALNGGGSITDT